MKHAVCLVVDRLSAGFLGAYGNTWIDTPAFDRLASESMVVDQMFVDSPRLDDLYDAVWRGSHKACPGGTTSLLDNLAAADIASILLTDDREVAELELSQRFERIDLIEVHPTDCAAQEADQTHLASLFAAATELASDLSQSTMLWLHTCGLSSVWDAPLEMRARYSSEDDPEPYARADVPHLELAADHDPDDLLPYLHAYAGQVTLWDECLGGFLGALDDAFSEDLLLIVLGARGFAVGEHGLLGNPQNGSGAEPLFEELVHVPCALRIAASAATRSQQLVQPADINFTLAHWFGAERFGVAHCDTHAFPALNLLAGQSPEQIARTRAVIQGHGGEWAIRTLEWYLRNSADRRQQLFAKPDDRWEVNDVADRCPDIVEALNEAYRATLRGDWTSWLECQE